MSAAKHSRSAEVVATERAILDHRGVIEDPFARTMLGPAVGALFRVARRWPDRIPTLPVTLAGLATRVRWHDQNVVEALDSGIGQVAVVGAGFDSRAWRLARDGVRFFEVDHPATQAEKVRRAPSAGPTFVAADLTVESAADALIAGGFDATKPAVVVLEGVTMYLYEADVRRQLIELSGAVAPGSVLTTDFYPPQDVGTADHQRQNRLQRLARSGSGEGLRLLVDKAGSAALVDACGWKVDRAAGAREAAADLLPSGCDLPVGAINDAKTLLVATRS